MKWLFGILFGALVLIGLGLGLLGNSPEISVSKNTEATLLYEEGTKDMMAYCNAEAVTKLDKALQLDPSMAEAKISLVAALAGLGQRKKAQAALADADSLTNLIKDDKRRMIAQLRLGNMGLEKFHSMRDSLVASIKEIEPTNIHLLINEANRAYRENNRQEAETLYREILDVDPNYAGSYNMLGYMELRDGNFEQAIEYMQKYAFLAPNLANPHDSMGEVLMVMGRYEEAEKEFRTAISMQPGFYNSLISLGVVHIARGQLKTGVKILQDISKTVAGTEIEKAIDAGMISTCHVIGMEDLMAQKTAEYIAKYPTDQTSCIFRAYLLAKSGQAALGQAVMDSCTAEMRKNNSQEIRAESNARTYEAIVAEQNGDYTTAVRMWKQVEELNRNHFDIQKRWRPYYYLARALRLDGKPAEALAQITHVLQVNSRQIQSLIVAADCQLDLNQPEEARKTIGQLRRSLKWADDDYPAHSDLQRLELAVSELENNS